MNKRIVWALAALVLSLMSLVAFSPSAGAAPTATSTVCFAGDEGWDFSASSEKWPTAIEPKQFTDAGLILDLAKAPRAGGKQAGYVAVSDSLYNAAKYEANGKLGFQYSSVTGPLPGYQLLIDVDNDPTTYDGFLVGESVYGNKWWATKAAKFPLIPDSTGGGSSKSATLQEFLDKYPTIQVTAVGFSLGSGVTGYGTMAGLWFGNQAWQFTGYCAPGATTTSTSSATTTTTTTTAATTTTTASQVTSPTTTATTTAGVVPVKMTSLPRVDVISNSADLANTGTPFNPWVVGGLAVIVLAAGGLAVVAAHRRKPVEVGGEEGDE